MYMYAKKWKVNKLFVLNFSPKSIFDGSFLSGHEDINSQSTTIEYLSHKKSSISNAAPFNIMHLKITYEDLNISDFCLSTNLTIYW